MGSVFATSFVPERAAFDASFATLLADDDALLLVAEAGDVSSGVPGVYLAGVVSRGARAR
ncbi:MULTISPECIES: hypothetical protein [Cellulosimicrobium]|uniref:hypothetical protein n=1 Tax=Cellulosimicrobium TaxID=157920 RepID=UPI0020970741|nr:hypothetical protein [Cellulosimicrobium cellulans]MCO7273859.1 hypothetical protein [Cellulosimicrobium cellulans]